MAIRTVDMGVHNDIRVHGPRGPWTRVTRMTPVFTDRVDGREHR